MGSDDEFVQFEFRDGRLVAGSPDGPAADPVVPNEETGFAVAVKPGGLAANDALAQVCDDDGEVLTFGSRSAAERFAARLSAADGALRVQAAAPNDPDDADAYLLAAHDPSVREPASVDGETWTFDVGANLYGALGEAVVTSGARPPALEHFVRQDLDRRLADREADLRISVDDDPAALERDGATWVPDCRVDARAGWDGDLLERYWCEVKTGDASFERSQVAAMRALAAEERVLKVRVVIDDLPDQYAVRIHEVDPAEG